MNDLTHLMFDIDGTLVESYEFDEKHFLDAIEEETGIRPESDWHTYPFVSDKGILMTFIERYAPDFVLEEIEPRVKRTFKNKIKNHLNTKPAQAIPGAVEFLNSLIENDKYLVSVATGGWKETALLKLDSAGFDTSKLKIASCNDHHCRKEIMLKAKHLAGNTNGVPITYFGDAEWDVRACRSLEVNLIIVGDRVPHHQTIQDYFDTRLIMSFVN